MPEVEQTEFKNAERLKFFTDAVVAIALTLLVLPLLEAVPEAMREHQNAGEWLGQHTGQLLGFSLSFVIVASFWVVHHRIYEHVARATPRLMALNFSWMFVIVFLQLPSALVGSLDPDRTLLGLYIGSMALGSLLLSLMLLTAYRDPSLCHPEYPVERASLIVSLASTGLFIAALLLALVWPQINYFALFMLFLLRPVSLLLGSRSRRN